MAEAIMGIVCGSTGRNKKAETWKQGNLRRKHWSTLENNYGSRKRKDAIFEKNAMEQTREDAW
jgi:hypothetical protein